MKNKIKKIIPLILCFVLVAGSCLTVNAQDSLSGYFNENLIPYVYVLSPENKTLDWSISYSDCYGFDMKNNFSGNIHFSYDGDGKVYVVFSYAQVLDVDGTKYFRPYVYLFSKSSSTNVNFTYTTNFLREGFEASVKTESSYNNLAGFKNGFKLGYIDCGAIGFQAFSLSGGLSSNYSMIYGWSNCLGYFEQVMSVPNSEYSGEILGGKINFEYAQQPTASIEPPKNLSIYRGYSNADKQYKFQMQWDKPADTDLNVEVMYNIHWKEGTGSALGFGTHVYKKYQHLVYDDGHSAQTNKLQYLEDDLLKGYFESQNIDVPSVYNIDEIFVRFAKEIDGVIHYSLWRKIDYMNLDEGNGFDSTEDDFQAESSTGAFDTSDNWIDQSVQNGEIVNGSEKEDAKAPGLDANGDNITNVNKPIVNPDSWDGQFEGVFAQFTNAIKSAFSFAGEFPSMLSEFFGFLPASVIGCISIGLIMVVVLRFLGR